MPETTRTRDVADELRELLDASDSRTIEEMRAAEESYTFTVAKVDSRSETHTFVHLDGDGLVSGFGRPDLQVGDEITVWDGHSTPLLGSQKHGWALNGEVVEWKTPFERVAERVAWLADHDRRQRERFAAERARLDAAYDALPAPLRARIDRFRERPGFRAQSEGYELFCCAEAVKIADALRPDVEAGEAADAVVKRFAGLSPKEQNERIPTLDGGHSGNTFGGAMRLALGLLAGEEL